MSSGALNLRALERRLFSVTKARKSATAFNSYLLTRSFLYMVNAKARRILYEVEGITRFVRQGEMAGSEAA